MKGFAIVWTLAVLTTLAFSQQVKPIPALSTSDKIAIDACEKAKGDAQKQFSGAQQQELAVLREFEAAHPGYRVNPQTYTVEAIPAPKPEPKQEGKK